MEIEVECPKCGCKHTIDIDLSDYANDSRYA